MKEQVASGSYEIKIVGLSEGRHQFRFRIDDTFFDLFKSKTLHKGMVDVDVLLEKKTGLIDGTFQFKGTLSLVCDNCLDTLDYPVDFERIVVYKFSERPIKSEQSLDPDIHYIHSKTEKISIQEELFDHIHLSIPMRITCELASKSCSIDLKHFEREENQDETLQYWEQLKNLKTKNGTS